MTFITAKLLLGHLIVTSLSHNYYFSYLCFSPIFLQKNINRLLTLHIHLERFYVTYNFTFSCPHLL